MSIIVKGKVWKMPDHVYSDYVAPGFARRLPWEERKNYILHIHPTFAKACRPGDVIVAGKNFGCGPSREEAAAYLVKLGIACVVAESFARIFFRNAIAFALPVMECREASRFFEEGDQLELDFEKALVKNLTRNKEMRGPLLPPEVINIVKAGGIMEVLKQDPAPWVRPTDGVNVYR